MADEKLPLLEVDVSVEDASISDKSDKNESHGPNRGRTRRFRSRCALFCYWLAIVANVLSMFYMIHHRFLRSPSLEERTLEILKNTPLIDGHNDLPIHIRGNYYNRINHQNFSEPFVNGGLSGHVDLPRLSSGRVGGTFWSVFAPCPADGMDFSDENYAPTVRLTFEQVDLMSRLQQSYPEVFSEPPNGTTAMDAFRAGKIISPYGMEGLHSIGNSFSLLRTFYNLGVRYATLTHNCHNIFVDAALQVSTGGGATKATPLWNGVSEKGKDLIYEMNRIGMIVDLSHVSQATMRDVLGAGKDDWAGTRAPVIFSHSSAYAVCPHPRNVPDDVLQLVKKTNSLVMINFAPDFVSCIAADREDGLPEFDPTNSTLEHVVDHIVYIGELIGYQHVGLGSDYDGIPSTPIGLEDVSKFPDLVTALLKRGVSDSDAANVVGRNLIRVWKKVDEVALEMQAKGALPIEDYQDWMSKGQT